MKNFIGDLIGALCLFVIIFAFFVAAAIM